MRYPRAPMRLRARVLSSSLRCLLVLAVCLVGTSGEAGDPKPPARTRAEQEKEKLEATIAAIRQRWQDVEKKAREAKKEEGGFYITEVKANARDAAGIPAVGSRQGTATFEWEWNEDEKSEDPYDTKLLRATESVTVAGRTYRLAFLFDPAGKLLFAWCRPGGDETPEETEEEDSFIRPRNEWRLYFSGNKLLRRIRGKTVLDTPAPGEEASLRPLLKRAEALKRLYNETEPLMR
jgi:hypothetical protein